MKEQDGDGLEHEQTFSGGRSLLDTDMAQALALYGTTQLRKYLVLLLKAERSYFRNTLLRHFFISVTKLSIGLEEYTWTLTRKV